MGMEPTTKEEMGVLSNNRLIAEFMGYERVRIGYFDDDDPEEGETEWQVKNRAWMDEVEINSVGEYYVNVPAKEWVEEEDLNYHQDWNKLMEVWYKFLGLRFAGHNDQFKHAEIKTTVGYAILYGDINLAYQRLVEAINWYNSTKQ